MLVYTKTYTCVHTIDIVFKHVHVLYISISQRLYESNHNQQLQTSKASKCHDNGFYYTTNQIIGKEGKTRKDKVHGKNEEEGERE